MTAAPADHPRPDPWLLFAATPIPLVVLDPEGLAVEWNDAFEAVFARLQDTLEARPSGPGAWRVGAAHPEIARLLESGGGRADTVDLGASIFDVRVAFCDRHPVLVFRDRTESFSREAFDEVSTSLMRQAATRFGEVSQGFAGEFPRIEDNAAQTVRAAADVQHAAGQLTERLETLVARTIEVTEATDSALNSSRTANAEASKDASRTHEALAAAEAETRNMALRAQAIGEIAQQTRILALNISVGAARVGSVGQEFSVIAREVRALARRTEEIAELIESSTDALLDVLPKALTSLSALRSHIASHHEVVEGLSLAVDRQKDEVGDVQAQLASDGANESNIRTRLEGVARASEATLHIIRASGERLDGLKAILHDLERAVERCDGEPSLTPSDVFRMTRVIHHLVDAWTGQSWSTRATSTRFTGKAPTDVLARLRDCQPRLADKLGVELNLAPPNTSITPTQVFVRARRLVRALRTRFAHARRPFPPAAIREPPHEGKTPSDVFAQVDLLYERLGSGR